MYASDLTKRLQQKTIYTNLYLQQELYKQGCLPTVRYTNESSLQRSDLLNEYTVGGILQTTAELANLSTILASSKCPANNTLLSYFLNTVTYLTTNLSSSWTISVPASVKIAYYSSVSNTNTGGTLLGIDSVVNGVLTDTLAGYATVTGMYYYVNITLPNGANYLSAPQQMPYPPSTGVALNVLTAASTSLKANWTPQPASDVKVRYYVTNSRTPSGGTQVESNDVLSGTLTNTSSYTPVAGSYYYVGVTPTGLVERLSATAIFMPYPNPIARLATLTDASTTLTATWVLDAPSAVSLSFYVNGSNTSAGGTLLTTVSVASGTTSYVYVPSSLLQGSWYYCLVAIPGGGGASSSTAIQYPYPTPTLTPIPLTYASTDLFTSWTQNAAATVTVNYYSGTTSTPALSTDTLLATSIVGAISGTNSTLFVIQPVSGLYYYYTVTVGVYNIYISTSTQMPAPVATNVAMGAIGNPQGYLSASWNVVPPSQVTLQFYSNNTSSVSSGSPATIGSAITTSATSYTLTATLTPSTYYYVTVTPTGGAAAKPPLGIQMPASTASAVALGSLSDASTTLSANWSLGGTSTQVNATYYSTNSSTVPGTGGTSVATTSNIAAGVFTDTNAFSPIQGTYYYVGVVPTSGGSEVRSAVAIQMPYPTVTGATMGPLNSLSGALTCTWDLSSPSSVSVSYFVVGTNAVTGGTLVGSAQSVGSGTTANTYVQTLTAGQYYYAVITPVGGTGVAVGAAVQMPYPVVSGVTVGPLNNTSAALQFVWTVVPSSLVNISYYYANNSSLSGGVFIATTSNISSGTTVYQYSTSLTSGNYYYSAVTPSGGNSQGSVNAEMMPLPTVIAVTMGVLYASSTALTCSWTVNPSSGVTVSYYSTTSTAPTGGTLVGSGQSVSQGTTTNSYSPSLTHGLYYYAIVTPSTGTPGTSSSAILFP